MNKQTTPPLPPREAIPRDVWGFLTYILRRIVQRRKWLLLPLWMLLAVVGILLFLSGGSSVLPLIYIAF